MTAPVVEAVGLRRVYRAGRGAGRREVAALDGLSLTVRSGERVALLGPNGSGKSTLLRTLATIEAPDAGSLRVLGEDPGSGAARVRRRLGVVFQSPGLDGLLTVRENLLGQGALLGLARADAAARARGAAERFGVAGRLDDRVGALSGGLARRADLARAMLGDPELLLLDEPTTGLDVESRGAFLDALDGVGDGVTVVLSTHDMAIAERMGRAVLVGSGRVLRDGPPGALREELGDRVVRARGGDAALLREAGLRVETTGREAVGRGDGPAIERAAGALLAAGAPFGVASPTLEDAYLAHAGRPLTGGGASS